MLNNICISGRLTREPELRRTQSGKAVTTITLAVERDIKNAQGEREADFIDCVFWEGAAEFVANYFRKGQLAIVSGRLQSRRYTDKNGNPRTAWEIRGNNIYFGESKREATSNTADDSDLPEGGGEYAEIEEQGELPF